MTSRKKLFTRVSRVSCPSNIRKFFIFAISEEVLYIFLFDELAKGFFPIIIRSGY